MKWKIEQVDWLRKGHDVLLFGASDLGKTHLACAILYGLIKQSTRVEFTTSIAITQQLQPENEVYSLKDALTNWINMSCWY